jgi:hypothetical protein
MKSDPEISLSISKEDNKWSVHATMHRKRYRKLI